MDCLFCKIINGEIPCYKIYENEFVLCFLDINPMSNGHTLIVPKKHIKDVNDLDNETLSRINDAAKIIIKKLQNTLNPDGFRFVQNNGNIQEVKHYHLHIVPTYINKPNNKKVQDVYDELIK